MLTVARCELCNRPRSSGRTQNERRIYRLSLPNASSNMIKEQISYASSLKDFKGLGTSYRSGTFEDVITKLQAVNEKPAPPPP